MAEGDHSFLESPAAFPQVTWHGWAPTSTQHPQGRPLGHLLSHPPFPAWPPPRAHLACSIQCSFGTSLGNEGKSCGEISEFPLITGCHVPPRRFLPTPGGRSLPHHWQHSRQTGPRVLRMGMVTYLAPSCFITENQLSGLLSKITWPTLRKWCLRR